MSTIVHTYSPVCLPINWQSELVNDNSQRFNSLKNLFKGVAGVEVLEPDWPTGYGSLEHDNLPSFYQPAAVIHLERLASLEAVESAQLYCYDDCLGVLWLNIVTSYQLEAIDDLAITALVESLSKEYLGDALRRIYSRPVEKPLIAPGEYRFFPDEKDVLCGAKPLWVARMLIQDDSASRESYLPWLKSVDVESDVLMLGSGNSLLKEAAAFRDVHRMMILSQFHEALIARTESVLQQSLSQFNSAYYTPQGRHRLKSEMSLHQHRNDHIEYTCIQFATAIAGVQGRRRKLLLQFNEAWRVTDQELRIQKLTQLLQQRLDRQFSEKLKRQNRNVQTLLAFLGALSLVSLVADLAILHVELEHESTIGVFDVFRFVTAENLISITVLLVVILTIFFHRNQK